MTNKQITIKKPSKLSAFFICLIIASILWLLHALNTVYIRDIPVPVTFRNIPAGKLPVGELPSSVTVKVKASGLKLLMISMNEFRKPLEIDFNELASDAGQTRYLLSSGFKNFKSFINFQVEIKSVFPDTMAMLVKNSIQKLVVVKPLLNVDYKQGFAGGKIEVNPEKIIITGNSAELKSIDTVYTVPVYENAVSENISRTIQLQKPSAGIILAKNKVQLNIAVERLIERSFSVPLLPDKEIPGHQLVFFPSKVLVKITAPASEQHQLDSAFIKGLVITSSVNHKKMPVQLTGLKSDWHVIKLSPKEVEFLMIKK